MTYGVCVERTVARIYPTTDFFASSPAEDFFDDCISSGVYLGDGVVVLNTSADKKWYYIIDGSFCGYVPVETIAICESKEEWESYLDFDEYIVVTGNNIVLDEVLEETPVSGLTLAMGTKLELVKDKPEFLYGRSTKDCYVVNIPARDENGRAYKEQAAVPFTMEVNEGYLEMTPASIIVQARLFEGQIYGWGDSLGSVDCSGLVKRVYLCYGIDLPRNSRAIAKVEALGSEKIDEDLDTKAREKIISELYPGSLLFMPGHLMIYLGEKDGTLQVISSVGSYYPPGTTDFSAGPYNERSVIVSGLDLVRGTGKTWLESLEYVVRIGASNIE